MNRFTFCASSLAAVCSRAATPASASDAATTVVRKLYTWYFSPHPGRGSFWGDDLARAKPYFDPGLYALLADALAFGKKYHQAVLDFDPFDAAQIGATSYTIGTPSARGDGRVAVPVILTYARAAAKGTATIVVAQTGGSPRVYDIAGKDYTLRALLASNLKQERAFAAKHR